MPRDLFGQMTRPFEGAGARSRLTVPVSLAAHVFAVAAIVVVPLVASDALPALHSSLSVSIVTPVVPPPPPPPRVRPAVEPPSVADVNAAPTIVPDGVAKEPDWQGDRTMLENDGPGILDGIDSSAALDPPPPPAPVQATQPTTVRAGGKIQPPAKVYDAAPIYPPIAIASRVQGTVIIEATIGVDGRVVDARVLRSEPLLDQAALQAVRQWRYTPTRLNDQPVAVIMTVTVRFQLG
jgi:protein TonB